RAAPDITKRAIAAARKGLVPSSRDVADPSFARSLLERAEQTEAAGDLGRALDLARASRRALEIARRKARVADALAYADAVLDGDRESRRPAQVCARGDNPGPRRGGRRRRPSGRREHRRGPQGPHPGAGRAPTGRVRGHSSPRAKGPERLAGGATPCGRRRGP